MSQIDILRIQMAPIFPQPGRYKTHSLSVAPLLSMHADFPCNAFFSPLISPALHAGLTCPTTQCRHRQRGAPNRFALGSPPFMVHQQRQCDREVGPMVGGLHDFGEHEGSNPGSGSEMWCVFF